MRSTPLEAWPIIFSEVWAPSDLTASVAAFRTWSEAQSQDYVRKELRRRPEIGAELGVHAHASSGITDLSYHGIPIELKSQSRRVLKLVDVNSSRNRQMTAGRSAYLDELSAA